MNQSIVVVDNESLLFEHTLLKTITFEQYLAEYPKKNEPKTNIINLCDTEHYLSRGYYCSLLAEARQHKVMPSMATINDLRDLLRPEANGLNAALPQALLDNVPMDATTTLMVYFGWTENAELKKLSRHLFDRFTSPILQIMVTRDSAGVHYDIQRFAYAALTDEQKALFMERLEQFVAHTWRDKTSQRRHRWDMAILIDPNEAQPPSDKEAIKRFIKAASKVGIHAETITAKQMHHISQYDALFIRETTAIDHHTYRIARMAEQEGLVVIDDSTSILRCCNRAFLHDAFSYNKVPSLKTRVVIDNSEETLDAIEQEYDYPVVLKLPEGAFSKGVFKAKDRAGLREKVGNMLNDTALVLVQEYMYTDFDWRIGVLNGRAIFACRYKMAQNHWQIYNHGAKRNFSGGFETLPTFEVPKAVLDAAVKACDMIGKGLYGVDIKQKDKHVYVIEVNDNPSIDYKVEDLYLGNELYMHIMTEFANRLELRGRS